MLLCVVLFWDGSFVGCDSALVKCVAVEKFVLAAKPGHAPNTTVKP